ncbi:MAG: GntR family transcriptional regulator [Burkholderiaceae bacterium]
MAEPSPVSSLNRELLFEQIHRILWDKIRSGEIQPGQRLRDIEWAQRLNVSRTPVREAMRKMQQEGVLSLLTSGGYEVRSVSQAELTDLYRCRAALEGLVAEEVALSFDPDADARLSDIIQACEQAIAREDLDAAFELNTRFHGVLIELSRNTYLKTMCESVSRMIYFYRASLLNSVKRAEASRERYLSRIRAKQDQHLEILAALRARDGARASMLVESHIRAIVDLPPRLPAAVGAAQAA